MDELLYLKMIASIDVLKPKQIGTFLQHTIVDALNSGTEQNVRLIVENIQQLLSNEDIDFLILTKIFGINAFKNLNLLEAYEIANDIVDLSKISKCYQGLTFDQKINQEFDATKSKTPFMVPTPCLHVSQHPECKTYCDWQEKMFQILTPLKINAIER